MVDGEIKNKLKLESNSSVKTVNSSMLVEQELSQNKSGGPKTH